MIRKIGLALLLMVSLLFAGSLSWGVTPAHAKAAVSTSIPIDGAGSGRTFDGVGAISGGGGTSRLLIDYPSQQRNEILNYLFKPNYGASLQMLKVEIGGDGDSTEGAEASSQRTPTDQNYNRGYEWWLMKQAKERNSHIKLYALAWSAPGWLGGGSFFSQDTINYLVNWVQHAQTDHGLHIDYLGGWNERGYYGPWFINLKNALKSKGLTTQVVAADSSNNNWDIAAEMQTNPALNSAVDILGSHYPCGSTSGVTCPSDPTALSTDKPLWASENGFSGGYDAAAAATARALNRDYIDGKMTAFINWPLAAAFLENLPYYGSGLLLADQPWSGSYTVGKTLWAIAQTTQFVHPGWQYIDTATGYLGGDRSNGSYVTLKSPNHKDYSTIIETMDATSAQTVNFQVSGGLATTKKIHVWATNLNSSNPSDYFVHAQDIKPAKGAFSLTLQPGYIYSLTTTTGQHKGVTTPPARASLALPYNENFNEYKPGHLAKYLSDINGAFEAAKCAGGRRGICYRQVITTAPISWMPAPTPITVVGSATWNNYQVSTDALLEQAGSVDIVANLSGISGWGTSVTGYHLGVTDAGAWTLYREDWSGDTTLASGTTTFGLNSWHRLSLSTSNGTIQASIDGTALASVYDTTYRSGLVGLQVGGWQNAQFDNLTVTPLATSAKYYEIVNRNSGDVLDVSGGQTTAGAGVLQWPFHGASNEEWQEVKLANGGYKIVNMNSNLLLENPGSSTASGTQLDQSNDSNSANQWWNLVSAGNGYYYLVNQSSGLYADVAGGSTVDGTAVVQEPTSGATSQQWSIVEIS